VTEPLRRLWDDEAEAWAAWARAPDHDTFWHFTRWRLLEVLPEPGGLTVDLGGGEGRLARELTTHGHRVVGIDSSETLTRLAVTHDEATAAAVGDLAALPVATETADLAVACMSLQDVDDLDGAVREAARILRPGGRLAVDGSLRAVDGTYQAYGQKLGIDRGVLTFVGPIENPRLDIEATRPNLDVRVGVVVAGTALNPRIRLFSEPDMTDIDKLSWLVLGRASAGVGSNDTALLQSAALALLSGEGPGLTDRLTHAIGLDAISVRQQSEGEVKETIVSLGKQISKRWYVGYERGLNATTGSWQLIYRIAQRLTVRAQAGGDNSLDLIWTLRWK